MKISKQILIRRWLWRKVPGRPGMIKNCLALLACCSILLLNGGEVEFIVTGDLHGRLEKLALLAPEISKYPRAVKADLGDIVQGNYAMVCAEALPVIEVFNLLGYDFLIPGNHDLEFGTRVLQRWQRNFRGSILAAQWHLAGLDLPGYRIIERDGIRIGVIGLGDAGLKKYAGFRRDLTCIDEVSAVRKIVPELKKAGCNAVVLLCHIAISNYPVMNRLLREVPEIDAVIGGHSHREGAGSVSYGVLMAQPGAYGASAVKLTLVFDEQRKFKFASSCLLRGGKVRDSRIMAIMRRAENAVVPEADRVLREFAGMREFGMSAAEIIRRAGDGEMAVFSFYAKNFSRKVTGRTLFRMLSYGNRISVAWIPQEKIGELRRRFSGESGYFVTGSSGSGVVKVVMSDFLLTKVAELSVKAAVTPLFERQEIEKALKMPEFKVRDIEKSSRSTKL